uniref:Uncharacterized protein n=1 Tax=Rhizophora mucronata TaxID=61149 RepID=A0A2P2R3A1_RHIMU
MLALINLLLKIPLLVILLSTGLEFSKIRNKS